MEDIADLLEKDILWARKHKSTVPEGLAGRLKICRRLFTSGAGAWVPIDDHTPTAGVEVQIAYENGTTSLGSFHYVQDRTFVTDLVQRTYNGKILYWKPKEDGP